MPFIEEDRRLELETPATTRTVLIVLLGLGPLLVLVQAIRMSRRRGDLVAL